MSEDKYIAFKRDEGKCRIDLIPPEAIFAMGSVLTHGLTKYPDRNWEHGMSWGRVFGAMMRHAWAWWAGKEPTSENFAFGGLDNESKMSHSWHFLACAAMLVAYEDRKMHNYDDRPNIKELTKE